MKWISKPMTLILFIALIGLIVVGAGCGKTAPTSQVNDKKTIIDQLGRSVQIPNKVERIVTLPMPLPSIIYAVDGNGSKVVGMHPTSAKALNTGILATLAPELKKVPTSFVQEGFTVNIEELLKLKPDVVIQWGTEEKEIKKMEAAGIPVIALTQGTQDDLEGWIKIIGQILNKEDRASELIAFQQKTINDIKSKTSSIPAEKKPKVYYFLNENLQTAGTGTHHNNWIGITGGKNVAASLNGFPNVNMEQLQTWNPDIILISNFTDLQPDDILQNKIKGQDWSKIDAVKNKRVYKIPLAGYRWDAPSVESPLMLKWLAQVQYPDIFKDYSMVDELIDFCSTFYKYDLSNEKAAEILNISKQ
ncbi:MAG: ABC transporter substrate-binding protein [Syntrophomonas sp.]